MDADCVSVCSLCTLTLAAEDHAATLTSQICSAMAYTVGDADCIGADGSMQWASHIEISNRR
jgi:hypothetical protein